MRVLEAIEKMPPRTRLEVHARSPAPVAVSAARPSRRPSRDGRAGAGPGADPHL